MKIYDTLAFATVLFAGFSLPVHAQEKFIDPDMLDIEWILNEEGLGDNVELQRGYMFLAVLEDGVYKTFIAGTSEDEDGDGTLYIEEPNDLAEFQELGEIEEAISITDDSYTCYISTLPGFSRLFPESEDPVEQEGAVIDITTEETDVVDETRILVGTKSLPIFDLMGNSSGLERFTAFYNTSTAEGSTVTSFGFIALSFSE